MSIGYVILKLICIAIANATIYFALHIYFTPEETKKKLEVVFFVIYFMLFSMINFFVKPLAWIIVLQLLLMFLLTLQYKGSIKKRLFSIILIYVIMASIEVSVEMFITRVPFYAVERSSIFSLFTVNVISVLVFYIIDKYTHLKQKNDLPLAYWISIILIPIASLYLLYVIVNVREFGALQETICASMLFLINAGIFYLYNRIVKSLSVQMEKEYLAQQNRYYVNQMQQMSDSTNKIREFKHDLKNHLFMLHAMMENENYEMVLLHLNEMVSVCQPDRAFAHTGNDALDSILNYKLQFVDESKIKVQLDLNIPVELLIPSFDLTVIIGNLLDNAIEAVSALEEGILTISMKYNAGRFIIKFENSYQNELVLQDGSYMTTKKKKDEHGYGLKNVRTIMNKYNGLLETKSEAGVFGVVIMLYS